MDVKKKVNKIDTYYLIDYENVGSNGLAGCEKMTSTDHIIIFFTQNARKIDMTEIANHGSAELILLLKNPIDNRIFEERLLRRLQSSTPPAAAKFR